MDVEEDKEERKDEEMERFYMIDPPPFLTKLKTGFFVLIICAERTKGREQFLCSHLGHKNEGNGSFVDSDVSFFVSMIALHLRCNSTQLSCALIHTS